MRVHKKYRYRRWTVLLRIVAAVVLIVCLFRMADGYIRPTVITFSSHYAANQVSGLINQTVLDYLAQQQVAYDQLIHMEKNPDGTVASMQADMIQINRMRGEIFAKVAGELNAGRPLSLSVPLGTLMNSTIFAGRGPKIPFKILPTSEIKTEFRNSFTAAGINQTRHQVIFAVSVQISAGVPIYTTTTHAEIETIVCETILVGRVPNLVTGLSGATQGA